MAEGEEPERTGAQRLLRGEVDLLGRRLVLRLAVARAAVDLVAVVLRAVAHGSGERDADRDDQQAGDERAAAPAELLQRRHDDRLQQAARGGARHQQRQRPGPAPIEPVHHRHRHAEVRAQARSHRDHEVREIEALDRVDAAEQHEAGPEDHHPGDHHAPRPPVVDHPALRRSEQPALDALHREGAGEGRPAPAELIPEQHDVGAEGVEEQRPIDRMRAEAGRDDPPAVEDPRTPGREVPCRLDARGQRRHRARPGRATPRSVPTTMPATLQGWPVRSSLVARSPLAAGGCLSGPSPRGRGSG